MLNAVRSYALPLRYEDQRGIDLTYGTPRTSIIFELRRGSTIELIEWMPTGEVKTLVVIKREPVPA